MKFNKGDIITNGKIEYTVKDIQKNELGDLVYILYNKNISKFKYDGNIEPHLPDGSIRWMCEQVDKEFYKLNSMKDGSTMTIEEMQEEINKMIPTPEQVLEAIDKKLNIINKTDPITRFNKGFISGYNKAIDDICIWLEDNVWDYLETGSISDFEILKKFEVSKMIKDIEKLKKE